MDKLQNKLLSTLLGVLVLAVANTAQAVVIDGTIFRTGGQAAGTNAPWYSPSTADDAAVEHTLGLHSFVVNTAGTVTLDVLSWEGNLSSPANDFASPNDTNGDGEIAFFDAMIRLYDSSNTLVGVNDDSSSTFGDGSIYDRDSYLSLSLSAGGYYLAVGSFDLSNADVTNGIAYGTGPMTWNGSRYVVSDHGDYRLTITGDVNVPEPGTLLLLGLGFAGLGFTAKRKKLS